MIFIFVQISEVETNGDIAHVTKEEVRNKIISHSRTIIH